MRLQLSTWPEVETYLKNKSGIIIPIGSTEQHGPTGFIGTDALCPEILALEIGERLEVMVAPTLSIGMAQHHLGFAGSVTLRPLTLISVICDVVNSLSRHGFGRFFFLNGHGGNIPTVQAAFSEIYAQSSLRQGGLQPGQNHRAVRCVLENWWHGPLVREIAESEFGEGEGSHATASEVALTYFAYPEDGARVHGQVLSPKIAPTGPIYDADDYRNRFADGRIGSDPTLATPEIGKTLFEAAVNELARAYEDFTSAA